MSLIYGNTNDIVSAMKAGLISSLILS